MVENIQTQLTQCQFLKNLVCRESGDLKTWNCSTVMGNVCHIFGVAGTEGDGEISATIISAAFLG
jgi:hypothetical protein